MMHKSTSVKLEYMKNYNKQYYEKNKEARKKYHAEYRKKHLADYSRRQKKYLASNIEKKLLRYAKYRAKQKGYEFNLTLEDIIIPDMCPYLNIPISLEDESRNRYGPSLDRIDSTKGYIKGNIQIISFLANKMKQDASLYELISFAKGVLCQHV